jgi:hypothetical protein
MSAPRARTTTLEDAIGHIVAEAVVWVRVAAARQDDDMWQARLLELTSGAAPPSWEPHKWEYPGVLFATIEHTGEAVGEWLRGGKIVVADREIGLPQMTTSATWERRQSRSPSAYESLHWPVIETTLSQGIVSQGEPQGLFVSDGDAPSFVNFYTAAACFFWLDRQPVGGSLYQGVMFRHQDTRGRLNHVQIGEEEVDVAVEGNAIDGMIVELAGDGPGPTHRISTKAGTTTETVRFPLEGGLPPGAWVLLRLGAEWIDRRFLAVPWTRGPEPGVEVVVEPETRLQAFLANREGIQAEFKRQFPTDVAGKAKAMKTVCAFANGGGGSILFGIDDDHHLLGVATQGIDDLKDQLTQIIDSWVEPPPVVGFETLPIDDSDKVVLELWVEPGTRLYGCARTGEPPTPYVRHYARTVRARPSEIEDIVRSRVSGGPPSPLRPR